MTNQSSNLRKARQAKNDEFYTQYSDINKEVFRYAEHLKHKVIYCNCDHPEQSEFYTFFKKRFKFFNLKKVITTHIVQDSTSFKREYDGEQEIDTPLQGNGDFRSNECKNILDEADIVITNPPFSLFREFVSLLIEKEKQFLIIGNNNAITYKEIFKLIKENKLWLGTNNNKTLEFKLDPSYQKWSRIDEKGNKYGKVPAISWFTNLTHFKRNLPIDLYEKYDSSQYPKYDNYDAIEVSKVVNIPKDYYGVMGVPITFLDKYCPEQFEIVGTRRWFYDKTLGITNGKTLINGKETYDRIFIKRKKVEEEE